MTREEPPTPPAIIPAMTPPESDSDPDEAAGWGTADDVGLPDAVDVGGEPSDVEDALRKTEYRAQGSVRQGRAYSDAIATAAFSTGNAAS